jgi:hypothetical protein
MRLFASFSLLAVAGLGAFFVHCSGDDSNLVELTVGDGGGVCDPATCPGEDTDCHVRACEVGSCVFKNTAQGTPTKSQVAGDCAKQVCDGAGGLQRVNDDGDAPSDSNECTADSCVNGKPSYANLGATAKCGTGAMTHCNGQGACVGCTAGGECPHGACVNPVCNGGMCSVVNKTDGSDGDPALAQTAGDCKNAVCLGGIPGAVALNDPPPNSTQCTAGECNGMNPVQTPLSVGTCNVGAGKYCNAGACVECRVDAHCGNSDECGTYTCSAAKACMITFATNGTPVAAQILKDCKKVVCDGAGGTVTVADTGDIPDDPTPKDCKKLACNSMGNAVTVADTTDIPDDPTPKDCKKLACNSMGNAVTANDNLDLPIDGNACTDDRCVAGVPSNPNRPNGYTPCTKSGGGAGACDGNGTCK